MSEPKRRHLMMVAAALPPELDGIGDYTAQVALELAKTERVTILSSTGKEHTPLEGVEILPTFDPGDAKSVQNLVAPVVQRRPDWVLVQYNPFSYGKRGWNPYLADVLGRIRREAPGTRIAVMAHETFVPAISLPFAVMATYQRAQFYAIGRQTDVLFLSIEKWAHKFQGWFPKIPVRHLAVGSAIPIIPMERAAARERLGIGSETFVVGLFGTAHPARMFHRVGEAMEEIRRERPDSLLLYVGPHNDAARAIVSAGTPVNAEGPFAPEEVSRRFSAMDIALSPYVDGVSTRRTAFMTGIQHGIPSVGTRGVHTDSVMLEHDGAGWLLPPAPDREAFLEASRCLLRDTAKRAAMGVRASELYHAHFDWTAICRRLTNALNEAT